MKSKAVIIGAGIAGLSSAIRLVQKGYEVSVYEQSGHPGGKLNQIEWNGYRWDTGPSLFTLPELVEELFLMCGEEIKTSVRYVRLENITRYFYEDGTILNAYGDPRRFIKEIESVTGEPGVHVQKYLDRCRSMYNLTRDVFIFKPFNRLGTLLSGKFLKAMLQAWKLDPLTTMHQANRKRFDSPHLIQLFDRYATYNGSNPYKAPGTLNVISHLEHNLGAYFPNKGMFSIALELSRLAERQGVKFHFNQRVEEVLVKNRKTTGILVDGRFTPADVVVSDVDIFYLYRDLLKSVTFPEKYFKRDQSTSALIFYWAVDRQFPGLDLHNILFSGNYEEEFRHLFDLKTVYQDPTVYIFISSKMVQGDAPGNGENWFVMINVPENRGQDWDQMIDASREHIIRKIERMLGADITPHIRKEFIEDPRSIEKRTYSYRGSLYGASSNSKNAAFSRHPNFLRKLKGLYFVGGSVHPGGGIPLCLASAKIADQYIK
ncbi:MAG: phytoene desaturase [Bacteroidales bacterium]|nr:phytoene desaturase [Bacteroidales bacterium]MBN2698803.1 phytoene desaturase [Bacteroidales bacterium]